MAEMFGAPIGDAAAIRSTGQQLQNLLALGELSQLPMKQQQNQNLLRKQELEIGKLETEIAAEKKLAELAGNLFQQPTGGAEGGAATPGGSMADQWEKLSRMAAGAGALKKAEEMSKTASLIRSREAAGDARRASAAKTTLDAQITRADMLGRLLTDVKDQAGWEQAGAMYQVQTGTPAPWTSLPYSDELRQFLLNSAVSVKDQAELERKKAADEATKRYRNARLSQQGTALELRREGNEIRRLGIEARQKAGGKEIPAPSRADISYAEGLLKKDFGEAMSLSERTDAAADIAAQARVLRRQNPALSSTAAIQRALADAAAGGYFDTQVNTFAGVETSRKTKYTGRGRSADTAMPLPQDKKNWTVGRFYTNAGGQVAKWTGQGFEPVRGLSGNNGRGAPLPDDDLEDDDDE